MLQWKWKIYLLLLVICDLHLDSLKVMGQKKRVNQTRVAETPDGCPFSFDFGHLEYQYKRPQICESLLPDHLQGVRPQQPFPLPFRFDLERGPEGSDDYAYYHIPITVIPEFNDTLVAGAVLRIERIRPNGRVTRDAHAGHLEIDPPQGNGFCCSDSKYTSLLWFFQKDPKLRQKVVYLRWYPMNFGEGRLMVNANIFRSERVYWRIMDIDFKVPILKTTTPSTSKDDQY